MNNGFGRGGPPGGGVQGGWNPPPTTSQGSFGGQGAYNQGQGFGQGGQFGFQGHGMQPQHMQMQQAGQYQNGEQRGRNDSTTSLTATGVEGVKMESPDTGTPEVVATPGGEKKEKAKRETRMVYSDNEISPVSCSLSKPMYLTIRRKYGPTSRQIHFRT